MVRATSTAGSSITRKCERKSFGRTAPNCDPPAGTLHGYVYAPFCKAPPPSRSAGQCTGDPTPHPHSSVAPLGSTLTARTPGCTPCAPSNLTATRRGRGAYGASPRARFSSHRAPSTLRAAACVCARALPTNRRVTCNAIRRFTVEPDAGITFFVRFRFGVVLAPPPRAIDL